MFDFVMFFVLVTIAVDCVRFYADYGTPEDNYATTSPLFKALWGAPRQTNFYQDRHNQMTLTFAFLALLATLIQKVMSE